MDLFVPLFQSQIDAASRLYVRMEGWAAADRALHLLNSRFRGFRREAVLVKVAVINQLYVTNVYAVVRMAEHIVNVMAQQGGLSADSDLVERIASLPPRLPNGRAFRFFSFAAKFAHFFIDAERFPIYDSFAVKMAGYHLGRQAEIRDEGHPYRAFVQNLDRLREWSRLSCNTDELDRYLWLAGELMEWIRNPKAGVSTEARNLFESLSPGAVADLDALLPIRVPRPPGWRS